MIYIVCKRSFGCHSDFLFFPVCVQGKIVAQGRLLLQDTFMVSDQDSSLLSRAKERRVFLFEQIIIFSEPLDKKKGFSTPGYLFKNSIKVRMLFFFRNVFHWSEAQSYAVFTIIMLFI